MRWLAGWKASSVPQERTFVFGQSTYGLCTRPNERENFVTVELFRYDGADKTLIYTTRLCYAWPAIHAYIGEDFSGLNIAPFDPVDLQAQAVFLHSSVTPDLLFSPIQLLEVSQDDLV